MKMYRKVVLSIFVSSACQSSRQDFKFTSLAVQRDHRQGIELDRACFYEEFSPFQTEVVSCLWD